MKRNWVLWVLALLITLGSAVYQRMTGPTHPIRGHVTLAGQEVRFKLERTHGGTTDHEVRIEAPPAVTGELDWKRYKTADLWTRVEFRREGNALVAALPNQPPAGKLMYRVTLRAGEEKTALHPEPVIIRYKGDQRLAWAALLLLGIGGGILGPVVQKYAFGAYWTGWPWGTDLTDNKTAVALLAWVLAAWKPKGRWVVAACVITLAIYLIPHSMFGSELDYSKAPLTSGAAAVK
ncbi:MAG: hypothetical protein MUC42_10960 [Bryobacter sp.]|nr:hypothetical protein [Bryobacter sp.]